MAYGSVPQTGSFPHFSQGMRRKKFRFFALVAHEHRSVAQFSPGPSPYAHSPYAPMSPYHPQAGNMYAMSDMSKSTSAAPNLYVPSHLSIHQIS